MSNAMRFGKRTLAGVAAGALALGALTIASAPAASAKPSIKPKLTTTATVSPVRATFVGTTQDTVPDAVVSWVGAAAPMSSSATRIYLQAGPDAAAQLIIDDSLGTQGGANTTYVSLASTSVDDTPITNAHMGTSTDDSIIRIRVNTAGYYAGIIADGVDTASFSFTTTGRAASMTLTPATQTTLVGGLGALTATLKDAAGNTTQPTLVDTVSLSGATAGTISSSAATPTALSSLTGSSTSLTGSLYKGTSTFYVFGSGTAGTNTVTATPLGTLPGAGVTTQTASITQSGAISDDTVANFLVTAPANALLVSSDGAYPTNFPVAYQVPSGTTSVTVRVDDTSINTAGSVIRLAAQASAGTVNGVSTTTAPVYVDVTTDANKRATATFTLGGAAILNAATLTVSQVNVVNTSAGIGTNTKVTITQLDPTVVSGDITVSPDDSNVAALGATTNVTITVDDSFVTPQQGWIVRAFRGSTVASGTFLGQATTNAAGQAVIGVTNAAGAVSGTTEQYSFSASPPVGTAVNKENALQINYSTGGAVTAMSVAMTQGAGSPTTPITNTTTSIATVPYILVPAGGVVDTAGTGTYTASTAAGTAGGNYTVMAPTATPLTSVTVTAPEGVKLATAAQITAGTLWSGGAQTLVVNSAQPVYVFGTKTGDHEISFTAGGMTVKTKVKIATAPQFAYNIDITPKTQNIGLGAFGTATVKVTDVFGNAVAGTSDDTGGVTVSATGEVRLGGFLASQKVNTDTTGSATVTVIAGNTAGAGALTAVPTNATAASNAPAYRPAYVKPIGAPAPTLSSAAAVVVTPAPATKSITITGSRTTVSGKPGIQIDGVVTGIEDGKTVIPYFRFPGETTFAEGSARPVITDGSFTWQRKTGKKFYAYVTNDDGAVTSNRVIIPAN